MNFNINKSLGNRIVFYVLLICTFIFILSVSVIYTFSKQSLEKTTKANALSLTQNTVLKTSEVILLTETIAKNYLWILENNQYSADSLMQLTHRIVDENPKILGSAIAFEPSFFEAKGRYYAPYSFRRENQIETIQLGSENYEYFVMDWYQIPMTIEEAYWCEPYYDEGGANALITSYSLPFKINNSYAGVLTIDLSLNWLTDIVSQVSILETGYAAVISRNGTFVTHPDKELIMNQTIFSYAKELESEELRSIGRDMQIGNTDFVSLKLNDLDWIISYTPLPSSSWSLAVVFPRSEIYAPLRGITTTLIVLIVIGLLLLSLMISKVVSDQLQPLRLFANSAHEIAQGKFDVELPNIETEDEMKDMEESFEHMQSELKEYISNLKNTTSAKEKIESELRIAREIQMGMIPKIFPPFPNIQEIDLYAMLEPAKEVGGDLYDFFMIDDTHLCFAIGDVSGKGVPASLFMAVTRTLLRSVAPKQHSPSFIINSLNKSLSFGNESNMFVTFFLAIIDTKTGVVRYSNAGHNPPVLMKAGGQIEFLEITKDIPVGLFEEFNYQEKELHLNHNDKLFLYTDGITEAENSMEELYSEERLMKCLSIYIREQPTQLIAHVASDVAEHVSGNIQSDDLTMLSIIYNG